uniref:Synaptic plasticity regulator PANTS n=1 Tax=Panthera leo TaxID=9689 RepID=A0A8C9D9S5_PANLE
MADGGGWRVSAGGAREVGGTSSDLVTGLSEPSSKEEAGWASGRAAQRPPAQASFSLQPPRPCETYSAEWKLCRSARHFLHHYYVHGERPACEQWRRDLANCREWEERRSAEAQSLCESERARVQAARKHTLVWALRQSPPADWHLPLPQEEKDQ